MRFCDNLKSMRKSKKISQENLAERVGVSRQSVSKWECGEAYPTMDNIIKLCNIFNCKINNLVLDDLSDIDSLDEEIKMSVVKFKKEKQKKMKALSKAIYIIARVCKIICIVFLIPIAISMLLIGIFAANIKIEEETATIFGEKITLSRSDELIELEYDGETESITEKEDVYILNQIIDFIENKNPYAYVGFIEVAFLTIIITLILVSFVLKHLEILFVNINSGDTPFTKENIEHIKKMAYIMISVVILPNMCGALTELFIKENLNIGFELFDIIYILFLYSMAYIFEYGYELQLDSKGKMYGEETELI